MAEPTSKYEIYDLLVRVAVEMGIPYYGSSGQEKAMPPIDAHNLDLCKKVVRDGINKFIADAPVKGWRWMRRILSVTFTATRITGTVDSIPATNQLTDATLEDSYDTDDDLNGYYVYILTGTGAGSYAQITDYVASGGTLTVTDWLDENGNAGGTDPVATDTFAITPIETVGGDIARYPLPENFGGEADGQIRYEKDTSNAQEIRWVDESLIRQKRAISIQTGHPNVAAIRHLEPVTSALSAKRRFELIVDPQAVAADTVEFPHTLFFDKLQYEAGDASGGAATTLTDSTIANVFADDYFNGWIIKIIDGTGKGSYATVTDYTGTSGIFTVVEWLTISGVATGTTPVSSDAYTVEPVNNLHPAGYRFDRIILTACLSEAEMQAEEEGSVKWSTEYLKKSLPKAFELDRRSAPRRLGSLIKGKDYYAERTWSDVTTDWDI